MRMGEAPFHRALCQPFWSSLLALSETYSSQRHFSVCVRLSVHADLSEPKLVFNPFPNDKLKESAEGKFKFDEYGRKFSK